MKYEQLKKFILEDMLMEDGHNYQPVMIKTLNQNNGKATKQQIQEEIHKANPQFPASYFSNSPVFDVLTKNHPVARYDENDKMFYLLDYETFTPAEKAWITMYCDEKMSGRHSQSLEELIKEFDQNRNFSKNKPEDYVKAEEERELFVKRFPLDKIKEIKLDNYVAGKEPLDKNTFSYLVEYGTANFGIVTGSSAFKHGIYVNKKTQEYEYDKDDFSSVEDAYNSIINGIHDIIQAAKEFSVDGDWEKLGKRVEGRKNFVNIAILSKILTLYFPEKFPRIWSYKWLNSTLDKLKIPRKDLEDRSNFYIKQGRLWDKKNSHPIMKEWSTEFFSAFIAKLMNNQYDIISVHKEEEPLEVLENKEFSKYFDVLKRKKQLIFYGPPGTGKTYTAKLLADYFVKSNSSKIKLTFRSAAIKILKNEGKPLHYEELTKLAFERNLIKSAGETPEFTFLKEMSKDIQHKGENSIFKRTDKGTYTLNPEIELPDDLKFSEKSDEVSDHYFVRNVTFHQSYSYEDFIEGIKPSMKDGHVNYEIKPGIFQTICEQARADSSNNYVLLIDEINRGNISKIFGELITLIENDKRNTSLQLAYSKEEFTVPENLYIIGTMNTADRSLIQIDAALRRRFAFHELIPKPELLTQEIEGIPLRELLIELNSRLIKAGLREKQVGHSYLMPVKDSEDLQFVFVYEIIPLLQDYFFDDYKKLEEDILSSDFVDSEKMIIKEEWKRDKTAFLNIIKTTFQL